MRPILIFLLTMLLMPMFAVGQQGVFQYTEERAANLTNGQIELLKTVRSKPQVVKTYLVTLADISNIGDKEQFNFNLPNENRLPVQRKSIKPMKENQMLWTGEVENEISEVSLLLAKDGLTGMIRTKNYNYDIYPLRDTGFHVLVEIDPSKFERESPPLVPDENNKGINNDPDDSKGKVFKMMGDPVIRVLVAYTTNAKNNYVGNINSLITLAEGNMIDAFNNSGINADISVVHTAEINYNESSDATLNLCRLTTSQTFTPGSNCSNYSSGQLQGYMNQIHTWRYQYDAHLVVLITGSGGTGIGWRPASTNLAFSIAKYDVAASFYTMSHEIGHNLGAAHDTANADGYVYPYGHGYIYAPANWSTILAYPPSGYTRINRYSNPNKTFAGAATGTAQYEDNARAINNRVGLVANFDPPALPPNPPAIYINVSGVNPVLSWSAVSDVTSYKVYRGTVQGAPNTVTCSHVQNYSNIWTTASTSYTDAAIMTPQKIYWFVIM